MICRAGNALRVTLSGAFLLKDTRIVAGTKVYTTKEKTNENQKSSIDLAPEIYFASRAWPQRGLLLRECSDLSRRISSGANLEEEETASSVKTNLRGLLLMLFPQERA